MGGTKHHAIIALFSLSDNTQPMGLTLLLQPSILFLKHKNGKASPSRRFFSQRAIFVSGSLQTIGD
jgi:hypothetical protein